MSLHRELRANKDQGPFDLNPSFADSSAMKVILASGSSYRQHQLKQLGLPFTVVIPGVDEEPIKLKQLDPKTVAVALAELKGLAVARLHPNDLIIAADQVAFIGNEILSKPKEPIRAVEQLEKLQGRTHHLATALWMKHPTKGVKASLVIATMHMKALAKETLVQYVDQDRPLDCAGSYKIESAGLALFNSIECDDFSSIIGLPLMVLSRTLQEWGLPLPFAWKS